jgi:diguanylate cyclase (GGDEF)-like protein/putative nucleotidyltransferase with HDIG domain
MTLFDLSAFDTRSRRLWLAVVAAGAGGMLINLTGLLNLEQAQVWQLTTLASVALLSTRLVFPMPGAVGLVSPADAFIFLIGMFFGVPTATLVAGVAGFIAPHRLRRPLTESLYSGGLHAVATLIAFTAFYRLLNLEQTSQVSNLFQYQNTLGGMEWTLISSAVMVVIYFALTSTLTAIFYAWRRREAAGEMWIHNHLWSSLHLFVSGFAAILVCLLVYSFGQIYILAIAPIVAAGFATCRIYFDKVETASRHMNELQRLHLAMAEALATAIDARDQTTHEHVRRVQCYATTLGRHFSLSESEIEALRAGALLHDIGKLAVPDYILNKPGRLTAAEFEKMKVHTTVGAQILERVGFPFPVAPAVRYHHERWDGQGYPEGLQGAAIPMTARILSVVDCFDAVREDRPYHRGLPREQACQLLLSRRGRHYDPTVVDAFLSLLPEMEEEIARATGASDATTIYASERRATEQEEITRAETGGNVSPIQADDETQYLEQINSAHNEIYALYEIARTFGSSLNLDDIMAIFGNQLRHLAPFDTCAIFLCDENNTGARIERAIGDHADDLIGRQLDRGEGVTGWALANEQMFANADPALDMRALQFDGAAYRTMTSFPLLRDGVLLGAISLYSSSIELHTSDHIRLLEMISQIAADAFHNALHHATTAEYALTDPLTRRPNARALHLQFRKEANRAIRENSPCCVLMMDLDGFKAVNDNWGHQAGDELLGSVSRVIADEMRSYDFLARYAGDEFVAILPGITEDALEELTSRIVHAVESFRLTVRDQQSVGVGISIGAARYPAEGATLERLLRIADRRMYKNKSIRKQDFVIAAGETGAQVLSLRRRSRQGQAEWKIPVC